MHHCIHYFSLSWTCQQVLMKYRVNSNKPEIWQLFHRSSSGWCSAIASEIRLTFLVSLLMQLAIQSKSYLPRSCIFRLFYGLEKQRHHSPGCTKSCSQEYFGNLSLCSALIILLFTSSFVHSIETLQVLPSPSREQKVSLESGGLTISMHIKNAVVPTVFCVKSCWRSTLIMIRPLELSRHVLLMCVLLWVKAGKSKVLVLPKAPSWSQKCDWNLGDTFPMFLPEFGGSYLPRKTLR